MMKRTLAILCTAAPFVAAAVAALGARHDFRILWMAIVATVVVRLEAMRDRTRRGLWIALIASTVATAAVAMLAGARAPFGVIATAFVVSAFATAGAYL